MALKKVMAVYTHEGELSAAQNLIHDEGRQITESFVLGEIDEEQIEALRNEGLIVRIIETAAPARTPSHASEQLSQMQFDNLVTAESSLARSRDFPEDPLEPAFYILAIAGPILDEYMARLQTLDIEIIERISPDNYTSYFVLSTLEEVIEKNPAEFSFIQSIKRYNGYDTGALVNRIALQDENQAGEPIQLDLLLHREQDLQTTMDWLRDQGIDIADGRFRKIRVSLFYDEDLLQTLAEYKFIKGIEQYTPPTLQNNIAKEILKIESNTGTALVVNIPQTGDNEIIGVADTGIDHNHADLANAIIQRVSYGRKATADTSDPVGHGTHVSGSIVGGGQSSQGKIKGTAPGAKIFFQSLLNNALGLTLPTHLQDLFQEAYNAGARIHNNSWGSSTPSTYTINSLDVDEFVYANKDMLIVISAGNQGNGAQLVNVAPGLVELGSIGAPATAKNALTVGACRSSRNTGGYSTLTYGKVWTSKFPHPPLKDENISGNPEGLAGFSSRGPTAADYRIKPDLVAPGTDIVSTRSSVAPLSKFWGPFPQNNAYAYMGGTSMAAPLVAGCAALVRQYYRQVKNHAEPSAALLKATLVNSTDQLTAADALGGYQHLPNYHQGFGRLNMTKAIPNTALNFTLVFRDTWKLAGEQFVRGSQRLRYKFSCKSAGWLRLCLAYTDYPVLAIQNKVQIILEHQPSRTKWVGNINRPTIQPILPGNTMSDNVQIIRVDGAQPGDYLIQVYTETLLKPPQDFAFVISGDNLNDDLRRY